MSRISPRLAAGGAALLLVGFCLGVAVGVRRGVPFVGDPPVFSIGIYTGDSPFRTARRTTACASTSSRS